MANLLYWTAVAALSGMTAMAPQEAMRKALETKVKRENNIIKQAGFEFCRAAVLMADVTQRLERTLYEVEIRLPVELWGAGDRDDGRDITALLRTNKTQFRQAGHFALCVKTTVGSKVVPRADGFTMRVIVFSEDSAGFSSTGRRILMGAPSVPKTSNAPSRPRSAKTQSTSRHLR